MASEIKSTGLASGLPINDIITKLTDLSKAPIKRLEQRKAENEAKKTALQFVSAQSLSLSLLSFNLSKDATFASKKVTSSDEDVLTATATSSATAGTYKFKVGQVAQAGQVTSSGFDDKTSALIGAGSFSISKGKNTLNQSTDLSLLNGGKGVETGSIRITDSSGNSELIDLTTSLSVNDVIDKINSASKVKVKASVSENGNSLEITNLGSGEITISEINDGNVAAGLGIKGSSDKGVLTGNTIAYVERETSLKDLNDGFGIDVTAKGINDIVINRLEGNKEVETFQLDLSDEETLGDVIDKINSTIGVEGYAYIEEGSNRISFKDKSYKFSNADKSEAATQLGIDGTDSSSGRLIAGLNDTLLRNLNGSLGISEGEIEITVSSSDGNSSLDKNGSGEEVNGNNGNSNGNGNGGGNSGGNNGKSDTIRVDATGSLNDFLKSINNSNKLDLTAAISSSGNSIVLTSNSSENNVNITVENGDGFTTATDLGLLNESEDGELKSDNLHKRKISNSTLLSSLNDGDGIGTGSLEIQIASGITKTISFSSKNIKTIKDAITQIQGQFSKASELEVKINDNGDGIALIDKSEGSNVFKITDKDDQKTATALGIAKTNAVDDKIIDGTREVTIEVLDSDSLEDVANKINKETSLGVRASIINDGSSRDAYRLSLVSSTTGADSQISIESDIKALNFKTTAEGLDSIVSYGSSQGSANPITLTSSDSNIKGGINGIDLNIKGSSDSEITINIERESESVKKTIQEFTDKFNETIKNIKNLTRYVPPEELKDKINTSQTEEEKKKQEDADAASGLLLGNSTLRRLQGDLYNLVSSNVEGLTGSIRSFSQLGIQLQSDGQLKFDSEKFDTAFKSNAQDVIDVFTLSQNVLNKSTNSTGVTVSGGVKTESGFNPSNLLVDTTSSSGYDEDGGAIGVKFSGKGYIDFNLGDYKSLKKLVLNQIDNTEYPASDYGLKKFKFQYKDSKGEFTDISTYSQNTLGKVTYTLPTEINTNQLRIEVLDGNPDEFRLLSFQAFESKGTAFKLNDHLKKLTTPDEGDLATAISTYDRDNELFDDQIKRIQERVDKESDRLTRQFAAMENVISGLQGQSSVLSQTLNSLPKSQ